jgi:hypothetical protein
VKFARKSPARILAGAKAAEQKLVLDGIQELFEKDPVLCKKYLARELGLVLPEQDPAKLLNIELKDEVNRAAQELLESSPELRAKVAKARVAQLAHIPEKIYLVQSGDHLRSSPGNARDNTQRTSQAFRGIV